MRDVQVGDVLECNRGRTQRVVRAVSRFNNGDLNCVVFTIMHCSWTGACTTTLTYTDLNYRGFRPTGVRRRLRRRIDKQIAHDANWMTSHKDRRLLTCCDVSGVP